MTNICKKHGEYQDWMFGCPKCKDEQDRFEMKATAVLITMIILGVIGFRYIWAKYVYHDARCMWAECRILK